ncbi:MAG: polysaccharide pyruvyl transferase family protein [Verrucomicrobia bacterium]|jgi:polysaccharide pyruvyl transferase WcaK-like protein|nr:polysaccharide pyruvyl transferase family protein [Verrucomicrobiota bacterium]
MRILFCGCIYGAGNIGDDAILSGFVSAFRKHVPHAELGAISMAPEKTRRELELDRVWGLSREGEVDGIAWATHVVLGGATLISENPSIAYPLLHNCRLIDRCVRSNKPVSLLGAGASNIRTKRAKRLLKRHYEAHLDVIAVRSIHDKQQASEAGGIQADVIQVAADAAFAMPLPPDFCRPPQGVVGVNLVGEHGTSDVFIDRVRDALRTFFRTEANCCPVGICSETRREVGFDYALTSDVVRSIAPEAEVWCDYLSCDAFLESLNRCEFVVTMRMHVLLFCGLLGIPCLAIAREQKTESMLRELGLPVELDLDSSCEEMAQALQRIRESPSAYIPSREHVAQLHERALRNAEIWFDCYRDGSVPSNALSERLRAWGRVAWETSIPIRACLRLKAIIRRRMNAPAFRQSGR